MPGARQGDGAAGPTSIAMGREPSGQSLWRARGLLITVNHPHTLLRRSEDVGMDAGCVIEFHVTVPVGPRRPRCWWRARFAVTLTTPSSGLCTPRASRLCSGRCKQRGSWAGVRSFGTGTAHSIAPLAPFALLPSTSSTLAELCWNRAIILFSCTHAPLLQRGQDRPESGFEYCKATPYNAHGPSEDPVG